jgi:LPXTG-motif cell wall-anchored protein
MLIIQPCVVVLLAMALNISVTLFQQPGPTATPTTSATAASIPTSPASATDAALGATSTALAATSAALSATTQALLNHATSGPARQTPGVASQTPRELPNSGGEDMPWGGLVVLLILLLVTGAWLRRRATPE